MWASSKYGKTRGVQNYTRNWVQLGAYDLSISTWKLIDNMQVTPQSQEATLIF